MTDRHARLKERLLLLRCQIGDEDAYRELVESYGPRLNYYLRKLMAQPEKADDVAQEVWLDVLRQLPRLHDLGAFRTWLYRIAHGKAMLEFRRNGRSPTTTIDFEQIAARLFGQSGNDLHQHRLSEIHWRTVGMFQPVSQIELARDVADKSRFVLRRCYDALHSHNQRLVGLTLHFGTQR